MPSLEIASRIRPRGSIDLSVSPVHESSFIGASCAFVREQAGEFLCGFLDSVNELGWDDREFLVFVYNTPLIPNSWPTKAPAWHVDGQEGTTIQSLYREPVEHLMCSYTYEGPPANTEYVIGTVSLDVPSPAPPILMGRFPWWHYQIEAQVESGALELFRLENGIIYHHDHDAFHRSPWIVDSGRRILMTVTRFVNPTIRIRASSDVLNLNGRCYVPSSDFSGWDWRKL